MFLTQSVKRFYHKARKKVFVSYPAIFRQQKAIYKIHKKEKARIAFIVSNLAMWRFQQLLSILKKDSNFETAIVLYPFFTFAEDHKKKSIEELKAFFDKKNIEYFDLSGNPNPGTFVRDHINPDILFYPQPYDHLFNNDLDVVFFKDKLLCYIPYAFMIFDEPWAFNSLLQDIAWRNYYQNPCLISCANKWSLNKNNNIRIVGDAISDFFLMNGRKTSTKEKKTIIWAPHFSIREKDWLHRGSFLVLNEAMLKLAKKYKSVLTFVFKPHPRLQTELYKHPNWGKDRADAYYKQWKDLPYTRMENGNYISLFQESDAMIHDCGSFSVEYHYTRNPVMFYTNDLASIKGQLNELGIAAINAHYIGSSIEDIEAFIENVVIKGEDPMKKKREAVYDQYLVPPNGKTAAENIYDDLVKSLKLENR